MLSPLTLRQFNKSAFVGISVRANGNKDYKVVRLFTQPVQESIPNYIRGQVVFAVTQPVRLWYNVYNYMTKQSLGKQDLNKSNDPIID